MEEALRDLKPGPVEERIRELLPPSKIGVGAVSLAALMCCEARKHRFRAQVAADPETGDLTKQSLMIRLKMGACIDSFLDWCASALALFPTFLVFLLRRAPIRRKLHRALWMTFYAAAVVASFVYLPTVAAVFVSFPFLLLFIVVFFAGLFANSEKYEAALDTWMVRLAAARDRLLKQRAIVTSIYQDMLRKPLDHIEGLADSPYEALMREKAHAFEASLQELRGEFEGHTRAVAYIDMVRGLVTEQAEDRADSRTRWERAQFDLDRIAESKRWKSTIMAVEISGGLTGFKILWGIVFATLILPVGIAMFDPGGSSKQAAAETQQPARVVAASPRESNATANAVSGEETNAVSSADESGLPLAQVLTGGMTEDRLQRIRRWGIVGSFTAILSLLITWLIRILFRIWPRHRQMEKAAKQAKIDGLENDMRWEQEQLRLVNELEGRMLQAITVLGYSELRPSEVVLCERDREQCDDNIKQHQSKLKVLLGKAFSTKLRNGPKQGGGVMDSGEPESIADEGAQALLDSLGG